MKDQCDDLSDWVNGGQNELFFWLFVSFASLSIVFLLILVICCCKNANLSDKISKLSRELRKVNTKKSNKPKDTNLNSGDREKLIN
jgi:hypothetical protein